MHGLESSVGLQLGTKFVMRVSAFACSGQVHPRETLSCPVNVLCYGLEGRLGLSSFSARLRPKHALLNVKLQVPDR